MRESLLLLASITVALMLASGAALIVQKEHARAAFPGIDGKIAFSSRRDGTDVRQPVQQGAGVGGRNSGGSIL
ncbi:MAG TPA: hypothetical protein VJ827_02685 [Rubrobacter sp.]|nr:hypothetical protein [Rubrobacter sp.]